MKKTLFTPEENISSPEKNIFPMKKTFFTKRTWVGTPVTDKQLRKSITVPDQSLSVQEILSRFQRQIPVNLVQRQAIWVEQSEFDLERLQRMDFAEKIAIADELRLRAEALAEQIKEDERRKQAKIDAVAKQKAEALAQEANKQAGVAPPAKA